MVIVFFDSNLLIICNYQFFSKRGAISSYVVGNAFFWIASRSHCLTLSRQGEGQQEEFSDDESEGLN